MSDICINEMIREVVKTEVDKYLKEVRLEKPAGFEDDEIFLLSKEEYEKYKNRIPHINNWWWLRSPGGDSCWATRVQFRGGVETGYDVFGVSICVRPVLKIPNIKLSNLKIGDRFIRYDFPWIVIDNNLAIAEVPIAFDKFDDKSNDYENSYVRKFLKEWVDKRR